MAEHIGLDLPGITDKDLVFQYRLGVFHSMWATVDMATDFAIGKFLGLQHEDAHTVVWGMLFGTKAKLLANLIRRSDHPKKQALLTALNALRNDAKRDVIAHGYQFEGTDGIGFLERNRGGDFRGKLHGFTHDEFRDHVKSLILNGQAFYEALDAAGEVDAFVETLRGLAGKA